MDGKVEGPIQGGKVILNRGHKSLAIFTINLLPLKVALSLMVVRCKFAETDKRLKILKGKVEKRESLSHRIERAVPVETD